MGAGSEAQNRTVKDWMVSIDRGQLRLPSFQRGVAWEPKRVVSMLNTIIHDLPLGVALVLNVGDKEQFVSRPLVSAPETTEAVTEHLLDGQQRLTALYRALRDNDRKQTYFVHFADLDDEPRNDDEEPAIRIEKRWESRDGTMYPLWVDSPEECLRRGLVPVRLLDPSRDETTSWVEAATAHLEPGDDVTDIAEYRSMSTRVTELRDHLKKVISEKRETVRHFNLPYLRLPASTSKDIALSVFVNMNTNAKPLKAYDIVVAELEGATGHRLKEMEASLDVELPRLAGYLSLDSAVLQTSALLQGKLPNQRGFYDMDYSVFVGNWERMTRGLRRAVQVVESMRIFDGDRLPSAIPIPVIAALLADETEDGDRRATVDKVIRQYLWRSFFSNRYEATAATRAYADFRGLTALLACEGSVSDVPLFDEELYPLPSLRELKGAGWAKSKRSLARAILAASNFFGARDFADDTPLSGENVVKREYHHIFPNQLLSEAGIESMLALNCALITWKTNRSIGRLDPLTYLENRAKNAPDPRDIKDRLESHLVPYEIIANSGPYDQPAGAELRAAVQPDFEAFLDQRAALVDAFMRAVCDGKQPHLRDILEQPADVR
ncbi:hypothetical protein CSIV_12170 [Microbacterium sp. CSI-V]|uniref:DUF262 domain-containing protein n=1 Tax=unclassified Microbacterium TaxID=2609290 RepID=UPI00097C13A4|nr:MULTISPECIES: DUF262 domain-containing protein [unclassified Microbacterium]MXS73635.1 DUF262 domain-containing protein [Microbacterium sp. TL13]ONI62270.1 hypothetical protein CSIV_12170 [Microbacterium sp. CSI-V]